MPHWGPVDFIYFPLGTSKPTFNLKPTSLPLLLQAGVLGVGIVAYIMRGRVGGRGQGGGGGGGGTRNSLRDKRVDGDGPCHSKLASELGSGGS